MSLGKEIAPHLPFLRRHARAVFGSQKDGDTAVRAMLERIVADPSLLPGKADIRIELYQLFSRDASVQHGEPTTGDGVEGIAQQRLARIPDVARRALLLTAMEGFAAEEAATILGVDAADAEALVDQALEEIQRQLKSNVLIIEDEPIIQMDLQSIVMDLGHDIAGVARDYDTALKIARSVKVDLILADIQLDGDESGIAAVTAIKEFSNPAVIFITAFPERLLHGERPEPTFLITKPFQRSTVKAAIAQALFFDTPSLPDPDEETDLPPRPPPAHAIDALKEAVQAVSPTQLQPISAPLNAEVVGGQLKLAAPTMPDAAITLDALNLLREQLYRLARDIAKDTIGNNSVPSFNRRLSELARVLKMPLSTESCLGIGVSADGLARLLPALSERMDSLPFTDIAVLVADTQDFAQNFPVFRTFKQEAQESGTMPVDARQAAVSIATSLTSLPDSAVDPALKVELIDIIAGAEVSDPTPIADTSLRKSIANIANAFARSIRSFALDAGMDARKRLVSGVGYLIVAGPIGYLLGVLGALYPIQFGAALAIMKDYKAFVGKEDKEKAESGKD